MDGLPGDPVPPRSLGEVGSDQNSNNGSSKIAVPPPFGTNINTSPDPLSEIHRQVAEHQQRDSHGRFVSSHQDANPINTPIPPQPTPVPSSPPNIPNYPNLPNTSLIPLTPPQLQVIHNKSDDDPLFEAKINNPFSKFFDWLKKLIKNEGINIKIKPLTAIAMVVALTGGGGLIGGVVGYAFPHSSPILHREVAYQGSIQKTSNGVFLILPNSDKYTLRPKINSTVNFQNLNSGQAFVKGNLTPENFVIEASEIIPLNTQ